MPLSWAVFLQLEEPAPASFQETDKCQCWAWPAGTPHRAQRCPRHRDLGPALSWPDPGLLAQGWQALSQEHPDSITALPPCLSLTHEIPSKTSGHQALPLAPPLKPGPSFLGK